MRELHPRHHWDEEGASRVCQRCRVCTCHAPQLAPRECADKWIHETHQVETNTGDWNCNKCGQSAFFQPETLKKECKYA